MADPSRKRRGLKLSLEVVSVTHLTSCVLELVRNREDAYYIYLTMKGKETSRSGLNDVASCGFGLLTKFQ